MKTVIINHEQVTNPLIMHCARDTTSGKAYPVVAEYAQGAIYDGAITAQFDSIKFVDDRGDNVVVWANEPGITVQEVAE